MFDPSDMEIRLDDFIEYNWSSSEFGEIEEAKPMNAPESRGMGFTMVAYVDTDHVGNVVTQRSRTRFLIFLSDSTIYWMSKKQQSIETSSLGAGFIAMKQCTEYLRGLRYKLRMMGIPCDGPSYAYGDN